MNWIKCALGFGSHNHNVAKILATNANDEEYNNDYNNENNNQYDESPFGYDETMYTGNDDDDDNDTDNDNGQLKNNNVKENRKRKLAVELLQKHNVNKSQKARGYLNILEVAGKANVDQLEVRKFRKTLLSNGNALFEPAPFVDKVLVISPEWEQEKNNEAVRILIAHNVGKNQRKKC